MSQIIFNDLELDSREELQFIYWLEEMKDNNFIEFYKYHPREFILFDSLEIFSKVRLRSHIYTPDFYIKFSKDKILNKNFKEYFLFKDLDKQDLSVYVDIKGVFNKNAGDRLFSINQKWVYSLYKIYIYKIVPDDLFKETFIPNLCRYTPVKNNLIEKYKDYRKISDMILDDIR